MDSRSGFEVPRKSDGVCNTPKAIPPTKLHARLFKLLCQYRCYRVKHLMPLVWRLEGLLSLSSCAIQLTDWEGDVPAQVQLVPSLQRR
jgi:hypothetical protein